MNARVAWANAAVSATSLLPEAILFSLLLPLPAAQQQSPEFRQLVGLGILRGNGGMCFAKTFIWSAAAAARTCPVDAVHADVASLTMRSVPVGCHSQRADAGLASELSRATSTCN